MTPDTDQTAMPARRIRAAPAAPAPAIELHGICKSFGPVQANQDIDLTVARGTIHGIVGENGAGKSTLMSILYGFYQPDAGTIRINGRNLAITDSQTAIRSGIGMVFQHFKLVPNFTVLENVILGAEDGPWLARSLARARDELQRLAADYDLQVDPDETVSNLSVGHQQRVEILKALYRQADILILDEPTGVLTPPEADHLFRILRGLRAQGKTIVLITHKLREIMDLTDRVSVMRRGQMVATLATEGTGPEQLAELMVGRRVLMQVDKTPAQPGRVLLELRGLRMTDAAGVERLRGIDLTLHAGEILGLAGVSGNGQSELLDILGGYPEPGARIQGSLQLDGRYTPVAEMDAATCRMAGIGHIPEDRQAEGLIMDFAAWENIAFGYHDHPRYRRGRLMDNRVMKTEAARWMDDFDVRPRNCYLPARNFSGGNQQKIVVAREIENDPSVLLVGQPTRGVDIGAIEFIHRRIVTLRDAGRAILLVSVELDEIMQLSDRIAVMFDGRIMGERLPRETNVRELGLMMAGVDPAAAPALAPAPPRSLPQITGPGTRPGRDPAPGEGII